jgi:hypothetical protein
MELIKIKGKVQKLLGHSLEKSESFELIKNRVVLLNEIKKRIMEYGTSASGFRGHSGRIGQVGGSSPEDSGQLSIEFPTKAQQLVLPFDKTKPMTFNPGQQLKIVFPGFTGRGRKPGSLASRRVEVDRQFTTHMTSGTLKSVKDLGGGISDTWAIKVEFNGKVEKCLFKDPNADNGIANCQMAHIFDQLSGLNVTPPIMAQTYTLKKSGGNEKEVSGIVQQWVNGQTWAKYCRDKNIDSYNMSGEMGKQIDIGLRKIAMLDYLTCHVDRHAGNFVVDSKKAMKIWATDNDMCFHGETRNSAPLRYLQKKASGLSSDRLTGKEIRVLNRILKNKDTLKENFVRLYGPDGGSERYNKTMERTNNLLKWKRWSKIRQDD